MRRTVLEHCAELKIAADEIDLLPEELHRADEIFMTNALVGIQSVVSLDQTAFRSQAMASRLRQAIAASESGRSDA
jgi:branched-subunit amino acid aminotransferase/4-amino-4-deoxychorismate lyase